MIHNALNKINEINAKANEGFVRGYSMPFHCMNELYSRKLGCTTYICGHEYSGKTEIELEIDVWLAKRHGLSTLIFTPETGSVEEIFLEIGHKWCGKPLIGKYAISEGERFKVLMEIQQYFHVVEVDKPISYNEIIAKMSQYENDYGLTIQNIVIDPFNELKHDLQGQPRDLWLEDFLGHVRRSARELKKHITIITHPRDSDRLYHKDGYLLASTRKDYAGGQAWPRKGESMIAFWRPPQNATDEHGMPYADNEAHFTVQKAKPKGIGSLGTAVIYFDFKRSAYFEFVNGKKYYAGEYENEQQSQIEERNYTQITIDEPPF